MKTRRADGLSFLITGLFLCAACRTLAADAEVHWQDYVGFSTHDVAINVGEKVTVFNDDPDGSSIVITSSLPETSADYFYFDLPNGTSKTHTYNAAGTFTFASEHVEDGVVTVTVGGGGGGVGGPISLSSPAIIDNQFVFNATGLTVGATDVLQGSTNLVDWVSIQTNVASSASAMFTNSVAAPCYYHRILQLP